MTTLGCSLWAQNSCVQRTVACVADCSVLRDDWMVSDGNRTSLRCFPGEEVVVAGDLIEYGWPESEEGKGGEKEKKGGKREEKGKGFMKIRDFSSLNWVFLELNFKGLGFSFEGQIKGEEFEIGSFEVLDF